MAVLFYSITWRGMSRHVVTSHLIPPHHTPLPYMTLGQTTAIHTMPDHLTSHDMNEERPSSRD